MITDRHRVILQGVHRQHHRIGRRVVAFVVKILERRALDRVAGINEDQIGIIFAGLLDQRRHLGDADVVVLVRVVIDGKDSPMHVSGAENDYVRALRIGMLTSCTDRACQQNNRN